MSDKLKAALADICAVTMTIGTILLLGWMLTNYLTDPPCISCCKDGSTRCNPGAM